MTRRPTSPPPCDRVCWQWIPHHGPRTWAYTHSARTCGHYFDETARQWRWKDKPR